MNNKFITLLAALIVTGLLPAFAADDSAVTVILTPRPAATPHLTGAVR